jgi:LemA protein
MTGIILLAIAALISAVAIGIYNRLVAGRNRAKNAFAQIDVQLKRRHDLIPNLVECVKGYMQYEKLTLEAVIAARTAAVAASARVAGDPTNAQAVQGVASAESALSGSVGKIFALSEKYPDLKANQNMLALQEELTSTENRIAFARQGYNDEVMTYNVSCQSFPATLFAGMLGFKPAESLQAIEKPEEREAAAIKI